jgi:uncharacterized protein (TIGR02996 family)
VTDDELALLAAVLASPGDDTPRLVYADWLDEHGRPERAEFIRCQVRIAEIGRELQSEEDCEQKCCAERIALRRRERELLTAHGDEWFGVDLRDENRDTTEPLPPLRTSRGFVEYVACSWEAWVATYATALYWRAEVACPACGGDGDRYWEKGSPYRDVDSRCPACEDGTGRVPNPDPPPPTAQPVREVALTGCQWWPPFPNAVIVESENHGIQAVSHPDYPGVTFRQPNPFAFGDFPRVQVPRGG